MAVRRWPKIMLPAHLVQLQQMSLGHKDGRAMRGEGCPLLHGNGFSTPGRLDFGMAPKMMVPACVIYARIILLYSCICDKKKHH